MSEDQTRTNSSTNPWPMGWRVVATSLKTGERRILSGCQTEEEAEAIVRMAVMRRGVSEEFFTTEPDGEPE